MQNRLVKKGIVVVVILLFFGTSIVSSYTNLSEDESVLFLDDTWTYRKQITIDHAKVDDDLDNFPVLIHHTSSNFTDHAQTDGDDFLLKNSNYDQLNHEIEYYDHSTGELIAWVNVTSVSASEDTVIWLYYGNSDCESQENIEGTWDSHYIMVQHLNESGDSIRVDSTSYDNDATRAGTVTSTTGKIGLGNIFSRDYLFVAHDESQNLPNWTISTWIVCHDNSHSQGIVSKGRHSYDFTNYLLAITDSSSFRGLYQAENGQVSIKVAVQPISKEIWCYLCYSYQGMPAARNESLYVYDEEQLRTDKAVNSIDPKTTQITPLYIGNYDEGGWYKFGGILDEIRISDIARSSEWISTSYNSQNNPDQFLTIGAEERVYPPVANYTYSPLNPVKYSNVYFTDESYDPDGTIISWWWDFGEGYYSDVQNPIHVFSDEGTYNVTLKITSDDQFYDTVTKSIEVLNASNQPPDAPVINGPTSGKPGDTCIYSFEAIDPEGHDIYYYIEWGDGTNTTWLGPYNSGEKIYESYSWSEKGTFTIKAKAKDVYEAVGEWGTFDVTMPKSHNPIWWLSGLLDRFPLLQRLLGWINII